MTDLPRRQQRELRTMAAMVELYCQGNHEVAEGLCGECEDLLAFAELRLRKCPFQEDKPTCANCPIHCYKPDRRAQIKRLMGYSGPRMALRHPIFAFRHWLDGLRRPPMPQRRRGH